MSASINGEHAKHCYTSCFNLVAYIICQEAEPIDSSHKDLDPDKVIISMLTLWACLVPNFEITIVRRHVSNNNCGYRLCMCGRVHEAIFFYDATYSLYLTHLANTLSISPNVVIGLADVAYDNSRWHAFHFRCAEGRLKGPLMPTIPN